MNTGQGRVKELSALGSSVHPSILCILGCCTLSPCRRQGGLVCLKGPGHTGQEAHQIQTFPKFSDLKGAWQVYSYAVGLYRMENETYHLFLLGVWNVCEVSDGWRTEAIMGWNSRTVKWGEEGTVIPPIPKCLLNHNCFWKFCEVILWSTWIRTWWFSALEFLPWWFLAFVCFNMPIFWETQMKFGRFTWLCSLCQPALVLLPHLYASVGLFLPQSYLFHCLFFFKGRSYVKQWQQKHLS